MKTFLLITAICVTTFCAEQETEEKQIIEKGTWNITGKASIIFRMVRIIAILHPLSWVIPEKHQVARFY